MLAHDIALALDPCLLMQEAGLEPDPWQESFLRSSSDRQLLLCTRQAGKSTVTAIMALHEALYSANALVLLLSPSLRQSQELFRKLLQAYGAVANKPPSLQESSLRLELPNGSRIVSLPGKDMPSGRPVELAGRGQHRVLGLDRPNELPAPAGLFLVELRAGIKRAEARDVHVLEELVIIASHPRLAAVECLDLHIFEPCRNRTRLVRFRLPDRLGEHAHLIYDARVPEGIVDLGAELFLELLRVRRS
jgi:hypothetical protein